MCTRLDLRFRRAVTIIASLILLGARASVADVNTKKRVALIGDSQAFLLKQRDALPAVLGDDFELFSFDSAGTSLISWSMNAEAITLRRAVATRPDVVLVVLGTNDACMGERVVVNEPPMLRAFLRRLRKVRVIWVLPPVLPERCQRAMAAFRTMLLDEGVEVIEQPIGIEMWKGDVHPSIRGRQEWAKRLVAELRVRLAVPDRSARTVEPVPVVSP